MKSATFLFLSFLTLLISCKEKGPIIDFGVSSNVDTTYLLSSVPSTDLHNTLVEEFTGQSCANCPRAHEELGIVAKANPNRVNIIAYYQKDGSGLTKPPAGSLYDFRNDTALQIGNTIYGGVGQIPSAGVDRIPGTNGKLLIDQSYWANTIVQRLSAPDSCNLSLESKYDFAINTSKISATITYTKEMPTRQYLSIIIVEDSMIGLQEFPLGVTDTAYLFTNVFRDVLTTQPFGDPILDTMSVKKAGRVYRRTYTYVPLSTTPPIIAKRCRVIAFISSNNNGNYHVLQSTQTKLIP